MSLFLQFYVCDLFWWLYNINPTYSDLVSLPPLLQCVRDPCLIPQSWSDFSHTARRAWLCSALQCCSDIVLCLPLLQHPVCDSRIWIWPLLTLSPPVSGFYEVRAHSCKQLSWQKLSPILTLLLHLQLLKSQKNLSHLGHRVFCMSESVQYHTIVSPSQLLVMYLYQQFFPPCEFLVFSLLFLVSKTPLLHARLTQSVSAKLSNQNFVPRLNHCAPVLAGGSSHWRGGPLQARQVRVHFFSSFEYDRATALG